MTTSTWAMAAATACQRAAPSATAGALSAQCRVPVPVQAPLTEVTAQAVRAVKRCRIDSKDLPITGPECRSGA